MSNTAENKLKSADELAWEFIQREANRQAMEPIGIMRRLDTEYPGPSQN